MSRIQPVQVTEAEGKARQLLEGVQKGLGMVPNMIKALGHSPASLSAYLGFSQTLGTTLNASLREQIALTIAGVNNCSYCASAHTALGSKAGIERDELAANLRGQSGDDKTQAALRFAASVVRNKGWVSDEDLSDVRSAGYSEGDIVDIVALVALNIFTNYFNHVADTDIDFPVVETEAVSA